MTKIINIDEDFNIYTETFVHMEETKRETGEDGKKFAIEHWADMDFRGRQLYDWVYGRESRMPAWATRSTAELNALIKAEDKSLSKQEKDGIYD